MNYQDRNNIISIIVGLAVNAYIIFRLLEMDAAGQFDGPDAINVWARMVIWVIPAGIIITIFGTILFNIGYSIATGNEKPNFIVDERDKMFDQRGIIAIVTLFGLGFVTSVLMLALGWSAVAGFNVIFFAMSLGSLTADFVKFISYRRGY